MVGSVLLVLLSCFLTFIGSISFYYLGNNTRSAADFSEAFWQFVIVTIGVAVGVVGLWLARRNRMGRGAGNTLGIVFTLSGLAHLGFVIGTLLHNGDSAANDIPPNLPIPGFVTFFVLLCGLEIAATLFWIIRSDRKNKLRSLDQI